MSENKLGIVGIYTCPVKDILHATYYNILHILQA